MKNETTFMEYNFRVDETECLFVKVLIGFKGEEQVEVCAGYIPGDVAGATRVVPGSMCVMANFPKGEVATMTVEFVVAENPARCPSQPYTRQSGLTKTAPNPDRGWRPPDREE